MIPPRQRRLDGLKGFLPRPNALGTLVLFPAAGAGASAYRPWAYLDDAIDVLIAQLPGREERFAEAPLLDVRQLASHYADALKDVQEPFFLAGHSFGAIVAFETAHRLAARGKPPRHLFSIAAPAPQTDRAQRSLHKLDDAAFLVEIVQLGGTPPAIGSSQELLSLFLPRLRGDFTALETYRFQAVTPLLTPVTGIFLDNDHLVRFDEMLGWSSTAVSFELLRTPGSHFDPAHPSAELQQIVRSRVLR